MQFTALQQSQCPQFIHKSVHLAWKQRIEFSDWFVGRGSARILAFSKIQDIFIEVTTHS